MPGQRSSGIDVAVTPAHAVTTAAGTVVASVDLLLEAVHFFVGTPAATLGGKCVAVNLSDIAAMGALPVSLTMHVEAPPEAAAWAARLAQGAAALAAQHATPLALYHARGPIRRIAVQVLGQVTGGEPLTRGGASLGDRIVVTGTLGDAGGALELLGNGRFDVHDPAHRALRARLDAPTPRLAAGAAARGIASAGLDLSDGLRGDLQHLLQAGRFGAEIDLNCLPVSAPLRTTLGEQRAWSHALGAGDDYELCLSVAPARLQRLLTALRATGCQATVIGRVVARAGVTLLLGGKPSTLPGLSAYGGYQHFAPQGPVSSGLPPDPERAQPGTDAGAAAGAAHDRAERSGRRAQRRPE